MTHPQNKWQADLLGKVLAFLRLEALLQCKWWADQPGEVLPSVRP